MAGTVSDCVPIKVLFFAKARELAGTSDARVELPRSLSGHQCRQRIEEAFPALSALKGGYVLAVNEQYVDLQSRDTESLSLKDSDEIAVIPPLSGG